MSIMNSHNKPVVVMGLDRIVDLVPPHETRQLNADAIVFWQNAESSLGDTPVLFPKLKVHYWDTIGNRYEVILTLTVFSDRNQAIAGSEQLAPGLFLHSREEKRQAVWLLKLNRWYKQFKIQK